MGTTAAFDALSNAIDKCVHPRLPFDSGHIKIVMYFDESQRLSEESASSDPEDKSLMDVLCMAIDHLCSRPFFVIFLSTNSHLYSLAPSGRFAKSARARQHWGTLQAPITEVPFDCAPKSQINPNELKLDDTSSIEFMAQFGRPL
jgi:hypothetical protein